MLVDECASLARLPISGKIKIKACLEFLTPNKLKTNTVIQIDFYNSEQTKQAANQKPVSYTAMK